MTSLTDLTLAGARGPRRWRMGRGSLLRPPCSVRTSTLGLTRCAGNRLAALPPGELRPLVRLRKLALNGNALGSAEGGGLDGSSADGAAATLDLGLGAHMTGLQELMLQAGGALGCAACASGCRSRARGGGGI
jgi:hypothetical protein